MKVGGCVSLILRKQRAEFGDSLLEFTGVRELHRKTVTGEGVIRVLHDHLLQDFQAIGGHPSHSGIQGRQSQLYLHGYNTISVSNYEVRSRTCRAALSTAPAAFDVAPRAVFAASPK